MIENLVVGLSCLGWSDVSGLVGGPGFVSWSVVELLQVVPCIGHMLPAPGPLCVGGPESDSSLDSGTLSSVPA